MSMTLMIDMEIEQNNCAGYLLWRWCFENGEVNMIIIIKVCCHSVFLYHCCFLPTIMFTS